MENFDSLFKKATALGEQGKHNEAADTFLALSRKTENIFEKANTLVHAAHAFKEIGQLQLSRSQLKAARELLDLPSGTILSAAEEKYQRGLLINLEFEDARLLASEEKPQEALDRIDLLLSNHRSDLINPNFAETYLIIRRDRAFLLADLGRFDDALQLLQELYSIDPRDRWILFYLGYCYLCTGNYVAAQAELAEAIQAGLPPDYQGRAHCFLGAAKYELQDFAAAKLELEKGVKTASPRFIKEAKIWGLLRDTCICLGFRVEAEYYASLDKGSMKPS